MFSKKFICATKAYSDYENHVPAPYMRRLFRLSKPMESAKITICGLGFYELFINGKKITKGLLAPYISNPDDVLYYDEYDLTADLLNGANVLGILLGNGMLNCPGGQIWDFQQVRYRSAPKVALALEIKYTDGTAECLEADESFKTFPSPILFDDLRCGEIYDAGKEIPGWNLPDFDDTGWKLALSAETPCGEAKLCTAEPIVPITELKPVSVCSSHITHFPEYRPVLPVLPIAPADQTGYLYDFGQNLAGNIRLKIHGKRGQRIAIQFGELLAEDGGLDLRAMSFQPEQLNHRVVYTLSGAPEEIYTPTFTYQGFRYCLVSGLTAEQATLDLLTYTVYSSNLQKNGDFTCSDPVANQLQKAVYNADISNFYYFPTDCPHREKNGWTADAALSAEQMLLNLTPENSYEEWLFNIRKAQRDDGALPGVIPTGGWGFNWGNGPAWDCVLVWLPYYTWLYRGNTKIILDNAAAIMRYLHYISTKRDAAGLIHIGLGDWVPVNYKGPMAPLEVTDTLTCMDICQKAAAMFGAVNLNLQQNFAKGLFEEFRTAARTNLLEADGATVLGHCQAAQAMAIQYGLFENSEKPAAFKQLLQYVHDSEDHLDVGCLGARVLFHVLSDFGYADLAYHMITRPEYPSYGHWVLEENATALFEAFQTPADRPNSKNHHFFGDISAWFIKCIAGIKVNPYARDVNELEIFPAFIKALNHAKGYTNIPAGRAEVCWVRENGQITLTVQVPTECHGFIKLPNGYRFAAEINGRQKQVLIPLKSGSYSVISLQ